MIVQIQNRKILDIRIMRIQRFHDRTTLRS